MIASKPYPESIDRDMKLVIAASCAAIFIGASSHRLICERHPLSSFSTVNLIQQYYYKINYDYVLFTHCQQRERQ